MVEGADSGGRRIMVVVAGRKGLERENNVQNLVIEKSNTGGKQETVLFL